MATYAPTRKVIEVGGGGYVDHFEDQFEGDSHEPLGLPFDEEGGLLPPGRSP